MKLLRRLSAMLLVLSGIWVLAFAFTAKIDSNAAEFPDHVANGSDFRGGHLANSFGNDLLQPKLERILDPISTLPNETQYFFSAVGESVVLLNDNGNWDSIEITKPIQSQNGGAVLNTALDMTKDFTFSWDLKFDSGNSYIANGLGFVLHPLYRPKETVIDSQGGPSITLPAVIGRKFPGNLAVTDPNDPMNGQTLRSLGPGGGYLGISDLMNAIGFKINTYYVYNNYQRPKQEGTYYGHRNHFDVGGMGFYGITDEESLEGMTPRVHTPYGAFVSTDNTGYSSQPYYPANLNDDPVKSISDANGSVNGEAFKVFNYRWHPMTIAYTASTKTLKVTIADDTGTKKVNWSRTLSPGEQAIIADRKNWAFAIAGSTGGGSEGKSIRNVYGTFTPAEPSVIVRHVDENGNDIKDAATTSLADWQLTHPGSTHFVDSSSTETLEKNGYTYRRAQVNGTFFENGTRINRRLDRAGLDAEVTKNGSVWSVSTEFKSSTFINYVYRRELPNESPDVSATLTMSVNGGAFGNTVDIWPGDTVAFKYSAKNTNMPIWSKVTAVQSLGGLFEAPSGFTVKDGLLYVPLNNGTSNTLRTGQIGENMVSMVYKGVENANLTANDTGQVTITYHPTAPNTSPISEIASKVAIYDQSLQLVDSDGNPVYGSYFYNADNNLAPLASSDPVFHLGNFIPTTNTVKQTDQGWWNIDETTKVLTIYPHKLDGAVDALNAEWPWHNRASEITRVVVKPGVTAAGSLKNLFADLSNATEMDIRSLDTSDVTDYTAIFQNCNNLKTLDLTNFKVKNGASTEQMLSGTSSLWKLTLGAETKLGSTTGLPNPNIQAQISDGGETYYCTDPQWKEVGTGSDHDAKGAVRLAAQIISDSQSSTTAKIYVWDQTGRCTMTVPSSINFGRQELKTSEITATSANQTVAISDTRNVRKHKKWHLEAEATRFKNNRNQEIAADPLIYADTAGDHPLSATPIVLGEQQVPGLLFQDNWSLPWNLKIKLNPRLVPGGGKYQSTVTFTLIDVAGL
ncbi:lectin-like domain-containing protein [Xylocopilactobacillus apicola]|uniref:WxL domain-containing protein n=1 Tax=Xylocopilactobacillus apicola TaxID=2932184 RepID=A0AAU9DVV0_9LACO|nr:BspA family leucine-rich repeat surface protein [Xylocopilactobacillus apicola]BDR58038.1 hypothetical protein XA3_04790 [Xylocopilactobacillus apicola]